MYKPNLGKVQFSVDLQELEAPPLIIAAQLQVLLLAQLYPTLR